MISHHVERVYDYLRFLGDLLSGKRFEAERELARYREMQLAKYSKKKFLSILDLANGRLRPQYSLLRKQGASVVGIDLVNMPSTGKAPFLYCIARFLFQLRAGGIFSRAATLVCGDVGVLPFRDKSFDLVTSVAAFEHFLDVPKVLAEAHRVLQPGGFIFASIHLFPGLSGGHNVSLRLGNITKMPKGVEPWDHLRQQKLPFTVPLNRLRLADYTGLFERLFEIKEVIKNTGEGRELLTREIKEELGSFSEEELLTSNLIIIAQKRAV